MATAADQSKSIEALLGVPSKFAGSPLAIAHSVEEGLPVASVGRLAKAVAPNDRAFQFRIVPKSTLERRRKQRRLTSEESNRVARLAKVYGLAQMLFRDQAKVQDFLSRPHMMLENKAPLDIALATEPGADVVVNLLGRAAYGGGV